MRFVPLLRRVLRSHPLSLRSQFSIAHERERERLTHLNILRGWTTFGFFHSVDCVDAFYRSVHFSSCLAILRSSLLDRQLIKHGWSTAQFLSAADGAFYKHRDLLLEYFVIYYCYYRLVLEQ